jgi:hypothetical protein
MGSWLALLIIKFDLAEHMRKGKKLKISMKDLMDKQSTEGERQEEDQADIQNDVPNHDDASKKSEKSNEGSRKNVKKEDPQEKRKAEADSRKPTLKSLIKQATNELFEERKKLTFPHEAVMQVGKEHPSVRVISQFETIHAHYFKTFNVFRDNGFQQMDELMSKFSGKLLGVLSELKEARMTEVTTILCRSTT